MYPTYPNYMPLRQPENNLLKVIGIEGARAYQMAPNSVAALFDANEDYFYIKSSDAGGFSTIKMYRFEPYEPQMVPTSNDYVTRKEFEELKEMIVNGKQHFSEKANGSQNAEQNKGNSTNGQRNR